MRFGVVGCGRISHKHFDALQQKMTGGELIAVCDTREDRRNAAAKKFNVPSYNDYHDMMRSHPELDVVSVLTPSGLHAEHVVDLSQYKKHILVEKPMALNPTDARRMVQACKENGIRLFVVKQNRTNPPIVLVREALDDGHFGKLVLGTTRVRWCRKQDYYDQDQWRGTKKLDGGVIYNQASHHVDLLSWLMGDVESVFAYSSRRLVEIETEDTLICTIKFKNGALGIIEATTATRPVDLEGSLSILGEQGSAEVAGFAVNEIRTWNFSNPIETKLAMKINEQPPNVYGYGHVRYLKEVIHSIKTGEKTAVEGVEGLRSIDLIDSIYRSIELGTEVRL